MREGVIFIADRSLQLTRVKDELGELRMDALGHWAEAHSPVALQRDATVDASVEACQWRCAAWPRPGCGS